jgi:hypothetical protein
MKKKLEADLMSIAHRVLQIKNKSDINQLFIETRRLYEKLAILQFVEEHFEGAKPTIGQAEIVEKMKQFFEENHLSEIKPVMVHNEIVTEEINNEEIVTEEIVVDEIEEEIIEASEEIAEMDFEEEEISLEEPSELQVSTHLGFQPAFELDVEYDEEPKKKQEAVQISFEDLLGGNYNETLFVKVDPIESIPTAIVIETTSVVDLESDSDKISETVSTEIEPKTVSLNETLSKGIKIDLNDRIAFVKHLFGNSDEDYNRVLNQLITYDSFEEAQNFIEDMVKPDYNSWEGKEDYSQRFIEIIEKKFD